MTNKNNTATGANSDGSELGLCINCEHALLESTSETCLNCYKGEMFFMNFKKAADKPESKQCGTCSNNPKLPKKNGTFVINTKGFPCNICANDYFYSKVDDN